MSIGDRIFWGIVTFVFVCLFWLKYPPGPLIPEFMRHILWQAQHRE